MHRSMVRKKDGNLVSRWRILCNLATFQVFVGGRGTEENKTSESILGSRVVPDCLFPKLCPTWFQVSQARRFPPIPRGNYSAAKAHWKQQSIFHHDVQSASCFRKESPLTSYQGPWTNRSPIRMLWEFEKSHSCPCKTHQPSCLAQCNLLVNQHGFGWLGLLKLHGIKPPES